VKNQRGPATVSAKISFYIPLWKREGDWNRWCMSQETCLF